MRPRSVYDVRRYLLGLAAVAGTLLAATTATLAAPTCALADNARLNTSVFANIITAQRQNGCSASPHLDNRLTEAARAHTFDVRDHSDVNGPIGSDGSSPTDRARAAGFAGNVAETIAINPAVAISGIEILNQWWDDPASRRTMQDCRYSAIGVWSENSLARTAVVAVYGQPA